MSRSKRKTGIVTDCVCDLPKDQLESLDIGVVYFVIETENGDFTDTDEITSENVIYHIESGGRMVKSGPPPVEAYYKAFSEMLKRYDEVVFVSISSKISASYGNAQEAVEQLGADAYRVRLFDSGHLSTGIGFLVLHAAEIADNGADADEIMEGLAELNPRICTSFITNTTEYLCTRQIVSPFVHKLCSALKIHPVLEVRNGEFHLKTIIFGSYRMAAAYYINTALSRPNDIEKSAAFITHVRCNLKFQQEISQEVEKICHFGKLTFTDASATISSNCGPDTFGVIFVRKKQRRRNA